MTTPMSAVNRASRIALACLVAAATACGHFGMGQGASEPTLVIFSNESLDQADVYAVPSGGAGIRIGTVMSGRTDTLVVPSSVVGSASTVSIVARLLAKSFTPSSGPFPVHPGDIWAVRLPSDQRQLVVLPAP